MIARSGLFFVGGVIVFQAIKTSVFASALILAGLGLARSATAGTVLVDAFANSSTGGVGADAGFLSSGQSYTVTVPLTDIWSAGAVPRWANANGLTADLHATGTDESGQPVGTLIGELFPNWTQGNLTAPFDSLVGSFGSGDFFLIGTSFTGIAPVGGGNLLLWFFDQNASDNLDHITATVTTDSISGVPEPSTWAMMILGFAGVGFMAFRKKKNGLAFTA
jgi:hypothetical protein